MLQTQYTLLLSLKEPLLCVTFSVLLFVSKITTKYKAKAASNSYIWKYFMPAVRSIDSFSFPNLLKWVCLSVTPRPITLDSIFQTGFNRLYRKYLCHLNRVRLIEYEPCIYVSVTYGIIVLGSWTHGIMGWWNDGIVESWGHEIMRS